MGEFKDGCPDVRGELWRLWTYQFLPASWPHFGLNILVHLILGIPVRRQRLLPLWTVLNHCLFCLSLCQVNCVHGDVAFLVLTQGLGVPLAALCTGFSDSYKVVSGTVAGTTGATYALMGLVLGNLLITFDDSTHGLIKRQNRLLFFGVVAVLETACRWSFKNPENSFALHIGGAAAGIIFGVVVTRNLKMTHFERTYLIPAIAWLGAAFIFFSIGW